MTQFGMRGAATPSMSTPTGDASGATPLPSLIGIGLFVALVGSGVWWYGEYRLAYARSFFVNAYFAVTVMYALAVGVSLRSVLNGIRARRLVYSAIAAIEAMICLTLIWKFTETTYRHLATMPSEMHLFYFMSGFAVLLIGVAVLPPDKQK